MSDPTLSESLRALQPWDLPGPTRGFWIHAGVAANLATQAATLERKLAEARAEVERAVEAARVTAGDLGRMSFDRDRLRDALEGIGARCAADEPRAMGTMEEERQWAVQTERAAIAVLVTEVLG